MTNRHLFSPLATPRWLLLLMWQYVEVLGFPSMAASLAEEGPVKVTRQLTGMT